jgi:selenide,water dikinase
VFQLSPERALVATVDFFAPVVDDAYAFGAIAAANAFSDLYAMGATPLVALNIVAWPRRPEILELLGEVLRGGAEIATAAGALIVGGHSIDDPEPKYGMVAIGEAHPREILVNSGARPGDALVLTKPLGTGILTTALKRDLAGEPELAEPIRWMSTLNRVAGEAVKRVRDGVHAVTDVTGFGLIGHLSNILAASRVGARLRMKQIPLLPHARELANRGAVPGGTERNLAATSAHTHWDDALDPVDRILLNDAQTSGGLLIAIHPSKLPELRAQLDQHDQLVMAAVIGEIADIPPGLVEVTNE